MPARVFVRYAAPVSGRHDRRTRVAVVRTVLREHLVAPGVQARHPNGVLIRIRTAVGEEDLIEAVWSAVHDAHGCLAAGQVCGRRRDRREQASLLCDGLDDGRMLVPNIEIDQLT